MNQMQYEQQWGPPIPPNPTPSSSFWTHINLQPHLKELHQTLSLASAMEKELEMLMKVKQRKGCVKNGENFEGLLIDNQDLDEFIKFMEDSKIDLGAQESSSVQAVNELMAKLKFLLEPFRAVTDEGCPWEEKSAAVRLSDKIRKSKRNMQWKRRKRRRVAETLAKEGERFEKLNREADEWRAREIAKDLAQQKVEQMKEIAKVKVKEERRKLEAELELELMVLKLQELRSIRIQKLKKQGHFLPEEDDKFLEKVRAAVEEEERQAKAAADTDAAKDAIIAAEESRKVSHGVDPNSRDEISEDVDEDNQEHKNISGIRDDVLAHSSEGSEKQALEGQSYRKYDYVANLPPEFYHYYHGSNTDMGTLIEVRRTWDAYIRPGGSRIPGHWVQPPPPADEIWASYIVQPE